MKIVVLANTSWNIYNYRLPLIKALQESGHEVVLYSPEDEYTPLLQAEGFRWAHLPLTQRGVNPVVELRSILRIYAFYRREVPDIVHHFTPKCVIYGSLAARRAGVGKIVNTITGLGYVFSGRSAGQRILQSLVGLLYRLALPDTRVVFQNPEDLEHLSAYHGPQTDNLFVLGGSGVNLNKFLPQPEPDEACPVVMLAARLMEEKGVHYFVDAARMLKAEGHAARFVLVGSPDPNRLHAITAVTLRKWVSEGVIEWWGWRKDMEAVYPRSHIVCLPTYYGEGIPKSLIEAAACARPIVATDIPGCRKVVRPGENGYLVPIKDAQSLAGAIAILLKDPALRKTMGTKSRVIAETQFSAKQNVAQYLSIYGI